MRAIVVDRWMEPTELAVREVPEPERGPGHARASTCSAAGCNFFDILMVQGKYQVKPPFPFMPGAELAGVVTAVGAGVEGFARRRPRPRLGAGSAASPSAPWCPARAAYRMPDAHVLRGGRGVPDRLSRPRTPALVFRAPCSRARRCSCTRPRAASASPRCRSARRSARASSRPPAAPTSSRSRGAPAPTSRSTTARDDWVERVKEATGGHGADVIYDSVGGDVTDELAEVHRLERPPAGDRLRQRPHPRGEAQPRPAEEHLAGRACTGARTRCTSRSASPRPSARSSRSTARAQIEPVIYERYPLDRAARGARGARVAAELRQGHRHAVDRPTGLPRRRCLPLPDRPRSFRPSCRASRSPTASCGAPRPRRTRSRAATGTTTGGRGSTRPDTPCRGAERRRLRPLPPLPRRPRAARRRSASTPIASRSSGAASSPRTASSRAPRSTTTGACARRAASTASSRSSPSITSRRRAGWRRAAAGPSRRPRIASRASASAPPRTSATSIGRACTLNEPNIVADVRPPLGALPARARAIPTLRLRANDVLIAAHRQAVDGDQAAAAARAPVGLTLAMQDYQAVDGGEALRDRERRDMEDVFLEAARGDDFIGVQTYTRAALRSRRHARSRARRADHADGLRVLARGARGDASGARWDVTRHVPLLVTENGIATDDDARAHRVRRARAARRARLPRATASTCAATSTGACSTTSSGRSATGRRSGWSRSTATTQARTVEAERALARRGRAGEPARAAAGLNCPLTPPRPAIRAA